MDRTFFFCCFLSRFPVYHRVNPARNHTHPSITLRASDRVLMSFIIVCSNHISHMSIAPFKKDNYVKVTLALPLPHRRKLLHLLAYLPISKPEQCKWTYEILKWTVYVNRSTKDQTCGKSSVTFSSSCQLEWQRLWYDLMMSQSLSKVNCFGLFFCTRL